MSTVSVTGNIESSINETRVQGKVEVMLCGYGSRVPRENGVALVGRIKDDAIAIDPQGHFSFIVPANDTVAPAGTYYTVTIRDDNGDIAQVNAYRFTSNQSTYDLNTIDPYDPNVPPPPLPLPITNELLIVPPSPAAAFDGAQYTSWMMTLNQDITAPTVVNILPGNLYTFILRQDGAGGHNFTWPAGTLNQTHVDRRANATTVQTFVADENSTLYSIAPGTVFV